MFCIEVWHCGQYITICALFVISKIMMLLSFLWVKHLLHLKLLALLTDPIECIRDTRGIFVTEVIHMAQYSYVFKIQGRHFYGLSKWTMLHSINILPSLCEHLLPVGLCHINLSAEVKHYQSNSHFAWSQKQSSDKTWNIDVLIIDRM